MKQEPQCWCGNADLLPYAEHYLRCPVCETLVCSNSISAADTDVQADEQGYYARDYWLKHQKDLGNPDIFTRARDDLQDRCIYWLREILKYRLPPAKVLEIGSAHGGLVALLRLAGYDASGLEISPWVVDFSHKTFRIPVFLGRLEEQNFPPASMDLVVSMDVLEHFSDPYASLAAATQLLAPGGVLIIQTPCYPAGKSYEELAASGSLFIKMLIPQEHIFLFSQQAVKILLDRLGFPHVQFEKALYAGQDMFFFASREPVAIQPVDVIAQKLLSDPDGRIALALTDIYMALEKANIDRAARLEQILTLTEAVLDSRAEFAAYQETMRKKLEEVNSLPKWIMRRVSARIGKKR